MKFWKWIKSTDFARDAFVGVIFGLVLAGGGYLFHGDPERFLSRWALIAAFVALALWIDSKISWPLWNYVIEWEGNRPRIVRKD